MLNLASFLENSALETPDKTAVICGSARLSYAQLLAGAKRVAAGLAAAGVRKGDRVALTCPNVPYFPMAYYGILMAGATVVPLNVLLKAREVAYHLNDSGAKAYLCFEGTAELPMAREGHSGFQQAGGCEHFWVMTASPEGPSPVQGVETLGQLLARQAATFETVQTSSEDTAVILYTSGTTGFPKGAELSHANMTLNAVVTGRLLDLRHDDVHAVCLPLFHSFGQTTQMNAGLSVGNTLVLIPRFSAEAVLHAVQDEGVSVFAGVPTMYWALLNCGDQGGPFDFQKIGQRLRIGVSGGASLPVEIINGIEGKYGIPILEGYGLSETSPVVTFNHLHKERKPGSVGTAIMGVEVGLLSPEGTPVPVGEVGEVVIRGHNVMKGYFDKPDATASAFNGTTWFHTGDLGRQDRDGYLYIVDRLKDMIVRGGFNVYPRELEEVLLTHPAVSLAAVVGTPHPQHGEEVKAYVVLKEGRSASAEEIVAWSKEQMAAYKYPRIVEIRETLPMTATGKILKRELAAGA